MGLSSGGSGGSNYYGSGSVQKMVGNNRIRGQQTSGLPGAFSPPENKKKKKILNTSRVSQDADFSANGGSSTTSLLGG